MTGRTSRRSWKRYINNQFLTPIPKTDSLAVRWLRRPLRRAMLQAAGKLLSVPSERSPRASRPKILLIRPDHLGDLLFLTPALKFLREQMSEADRLR